MNARLRTAALRRPQRPWRRLNTVLGVLLLTPAMLALAPSGVARAAEPAPELELTGPPTVTKNTKPMFIAKAKNYTPPCEEVLQNCGPVKIHISGAETQELQSADNTGSEWPIPVKNALAPGSYTAVAEQEVTWQPGKPLESNAVSFTVQPGPQLSITFPANGSSATGDAQTIAGTASTAAGDRPDVTVNLYAGSTVSSSPLLALTVQRSAADGSWSAPFGGLNPGTYTVQATQRDSIANVGHSNPVTFTLNAASAPPLPPPPRASFTWFPPNPAAGQNVALVSNSTDPFSPITAFAWDLAGNGPLKPGAPVLTTSFPTPGNHVVRLQVADARGATNIATETISVSPAPLTLMQPFPIVRIAGNQNGAGVLITLLTVDAPAGARVSVSCRGRGCNRKSVSRVATASAKSSTAVIAFRRPEHRLRAGAILEVRVSQDGRIGKYTRFTIHRHRLPGRVDSCLAGTHPRPIACPA